MGEASGFAQLTVAAGDVAGSSAQLTVAGGDEGGVAEAEDSHERGRVASCGTGFPDILSGRVA